MKEPIWLERVVIDAIHFDQLEQHGGIAGVRDENLLESALARPRAKWAYDADADFPLLAAAYGFGLTANHPYLDGNKRTAFMAMYTFLGINGLEIEAPQPEVVGVMLSLAAGESSERDLAEWIRAHLVPLAPPV